MILLWAHMLFVFMKSSIDIAHRVSNQHERSSLKPLLAVYRVRWSADLGKYTTTTQTKKRPKRVLAIVAPQTALKPNIWQPIFCCPSGHHPTLTSSGYHLTLTWRYRGTIRLWCHCQHVIIFKFQVVQVHLFALAPVSMDAYVQVSIKRNEFYRLAYKRVLQCSWTTRAVV